LLCGEEGADFSLDFPFQIGVLGPHLGHLLMREIQFLGREPDRLGAFGVQGAIRAAASRSTD
jgi:hypothetical protein